MGVYIKGMEMPFVGSIKAIVIYPDGTVRTRRQDPLPYTAVPVPPHGRLIEKRTILDKCYQHFEDYMYGMVDAKTALLNIEKEIKAAPTIIPAEEGE